MLLAAHSGAVGADHKLTSSVSAAIGTAGQAQIILHCLTGLVDKSVAIVDRTDDTDSCRPERNQKTVAIFESQIGHCVGASGIGLELEHDTPCSLQSPHSI